MWAGALSAGYDAACKALAIVLTLHQAPPTSIALLKPVATNSSDLTDTLSTRGKIAEAMRLSLPLLPDDARTTVLQLLQPASLILISSTIAIWAGSHFFGVGEIVDVVLAAVGVIALGFSVFDGAKALYDFAVTALGAHSQRDLQMAANYFAQGVTILGISTVQAILMHGQGRVVMARVKPRIYPRIQVHAPPPSGNVLRLSRPASLPEGVAGLTYEYGSIEISRDQSLTEQRLTLLHELVHRYFVPRTGPWRKLRAELRLSAYARSALMKYLEEALAEGYAQLRVNGFAAGLRALRFPLVGGYVTVAQLAAEGLALGTLSLGGGLFYVTISLRPMPRVE